MENTSSVKLFGVVSLASVSVIATLVGLSDFRVVNAMIVVHVLLGGLAFLVGSIAFISTKGKSIHKLTGRIFYIVMTTSVAFSLIVSMQPNHVSPSLFQIGVLTLYFLIGGNRSLSYKNANHCLLIDQLLAITVVLVSVIVMFYSVVLDGVFFPLRTVFGSIGIVFGVLDLVVFSRPQVAEKNWLILHLSKMVGGYTAAVTAFFVAQNLLTGYYNWFVPTVFGLSYIGYWLVKLKSKRPMTNRVMKKIKLAK
ncbi:DUF2306 domain-containing protein [Aliikangiella marina]|uniref:DUF2306 domain-containing protein n=1 Tax=Aliikangiella marina TaxID=1712262 RepID=A0A545TDH6_9GAMM|nr:DUF2306 domain-containing protein [Aliikangiella marina]TQV75241.1 DUF2306 domain-containing protein [Aliikangiella marina]